jgi:hypothetical protein
MFNKNDRVLLKGLNKLLDEATFPLKRREIASFAQIMTWLKRLEQRIEDDIIVEELRTSEPKKKETKNKKVD